MNKAKKIVSFALCLVMILALSVTAFADGGIAPMANRNDATHYIAGSNVNLRSGPGLDYSSGGYLQWYDECHFIPDAEGRTIVVADNITWGHIYMDYGTNVDKAGYTSVQHIKELYPSC